MFIPDAPYIKEAERRGTDYMYEWIYGPEFRYEEEDDDSDDEEIDNEKE